MDFEQKISKEIFIQKYLLNGESSPEQALADIAEEISSVEKNKKLRDFWKKQFFEEMINRRFLPAGRILANARPYSKLKNYGNCFVIPINDSLDSIYTALKEDALISGTGGGVGLNCSALRPKDAAISKGGGSSGPMSFLEVFDSSAKTIRNGGGRRSAHIAIMDVSHPDIEEFITYKQGDTNKRLQRFNISVGISQEFLDALEKDADWNLVFDGKVYKTLRARDLFNKIAEHAFIHNEPGLVFYPSIDFRNAGWYIDQIGKIRATNPCAEQPLPAYGVCNLGAVNLSRFVRNPFTSNAEFLWDEFEKTVAIGVRFLDNVIDAMEYPLPQIKDLQLKTRRIGLGITGLADTFAMLNMDYGDEESVVFADTLGRKLRLSSVNASCELAKEKGAFKLFNANKYFQTPFTSTLPIELAKKIRRYGLRNVALNTIAPVGTTSIALGENCSSGIEPIIATEYSRLIRTGNEDETRTEDVFDYAYLLAKKLGKAGEAKFSTVDTIDPRAAMKIQAVLQAHIDASISKTYNLPKNYTLDDYKALMLDATKAGLVGFTSYNPNGSLAPIIFTKSSKQSDSAEKVSAEKLMPEEIKETRAPKRPEKLPAKIYLITVKNQKYIVILGMLGDKPYECFVSEYKDSYEYAINKEGIVRKVKKGHYQLIIPNGEDTVVIDNIATSFNHDYEATSRLLSIALRHGVPVEFIVEQLNKSGYFGSWGKTVAQVLKKTIKDGKKVASTAVCLSCGSKNLAYFEGCMTCQDCGSSKCG